MFLLNLQKGFELTSNWKVGIGSQSGLAPPLYQSKSQIASFTYLNNAVDFGTWGKYYLGIY